MNKYLEIIQQPTDGSYSVTGSAYCFALFCLDYKILCKDSYAAITVFWACNNYRPSQIFYVSCKYSLSLDITHCLSQIFSLIRKYCLHLSHNLCHLPILTVSAKSWCGNTVTRSAAPGTWRGRILWTRRVGVFGIKTCLL